jgi:RNA-directed DNA polymerase
MRLRVIRPEESLLLDNFRLEECPGVYENMKQEKILERIYDMRRLHKAWQQVQKNAGAAGIDRMTVEAFEIKEQELLLVIHERLKSGLYRFQPARRVLIPKPGSAKMRKLGIPIVMDRIVAQSIHLVFEEIFDPEFTFSNFGFRPRKSQHQAIGHVRQAVIEGYTWCASIDLRSFFEEIPHPLILKLLRKKISDEGVITLVARALKAGVIVEGKLEKTTRGCPQGSPLSPILSNIVLNELDQELEKRGHRYCRWADDFLILVKTPRAAERALNSISKYLENDLGLAVNQDKSLATEVWKVQFLGFSIHAGKIRIGTKAKAEFKRKVKGLTPRNNPVSMYQNIQNLNEYIRVLTLHI